MTDNRLPSGTACSAAGTGSAWRSRGEHDGWEGLSADVIERFIEVAGCAKNLPRAVRRGYRADLSALDIWIRGSAGHTLVSASTAELWGFFRRQIAGGVEPRLLDRLLASMRDFYAYLRQSGCRDDDPAARLPDWGRRPASLPVVRHDFTACAHG